MKKLLLAALLSCSLPCLAADKYRVASHPTFAPYEFLDGNGIITGYDVDLIQEIAKDQGFEVEIHNDKWEELLDKLNDGKRDMIVSSLMDTEERRQLADLSKPYSEYEQFTVFYKRPDLSINSLSDLSGLNAGAEKGTANVERLKQAGANVTELDSNFEGLKAIIRGSIDAYYCDEGVMVHILRGYKDKKLPIRTFRLPKEPGKTVIAVKKGNAELLEKINRGIDNLRANGKLDELRKKWLEMESAN